MDRIAGLSSGLVVLGATGSIGSQTIDVATRLGFSILAVSAHSDAEGLAAIGRTHRDAVLILSGGGRDDRSSLSSEFGTRVQFGPDAVTAAATTAGAIVVNGIVGSAGLRASLAALEAGNRLALANKESLIAGGPLIAAALESSDAELVPVDSEHSALWQCLVGERSASVRRLVLTASGGPFRGKSAAEVAAATVAEALAHPTWSMGPRITIDSATLMNKAFEVIEAHYLFNVSYDDIDVVVHPQSIVHSLVEFVDGSVKAQLGDPDMRVPIQYALTYPARLDAPVPSLDLTSGPLVFEEPDREAFPCLELGYTAGRAAGSAPAVLNAADEEAVGAFLAGRIAFADIPRLVAEALDRIAAVHLESVEHVMEVDASARRLVSRLVAGRDTP